MKIIESICIKSDCYMTEKSIQVKGLMIHSVGCPQAKAEPFIRNWNKSGATACVHAIIEPEGNVYQLLPWNHRGWHCGGDGNSTHIGVEMCEPDCIKYTTGSVFTCSDKEAAKMVVKRTYEIAVELFAMLCEKYNLNPTAEGVILSHKEGHARGIASNHGDPEHLWTQLGLEYTMDTFRKAVKAKMGNTSVEILYRVRKTWEDALSQKGAFRDLSKAKKLADENIGYSAFDEFGKVVYSSTVRLGFSNSDCPFMVSVAIADLNIRKGAGTNTVKTGKCTGIGTFTIVEVKSGKGSDSGWGRLKSGVGWISLDYCKTV